MRSLDRQHSAINNSLVTLLVESERGDLRQQVVEPSTGARMGMGSRHCDIRASVDRVCASEAADALQNAPADGRVSRKRIKNEVDEAVVRVADLADDKGARVQALSQAGSLLVHVGVASKADLDDGASNIGLADTNHISVAICASLVLRRRSKAKLGKEQGSKEEER